VKRAIYASLLALISFSISFLSGCGGGSSNSNHLTTTPVVAIAATSGSPQTAGITVAFSAPLAATVTTNGSPTSGVSVTFTAPSTGASGTFANGKATETDTTNSSGVATSSTFTANTTTGAYTVSASASGATSSASFSLTNTTGPAATITASAGTPQSATVNNPFANPLSVTVVDAASNPVSGAVVTFTAPASAASGIFSDTTTNTTTATTNSNGVATAAAFTANASVGGPYTVAATVSGVTTPANFTLTNNAVAYSFYVSGLETAGNFYSLAGALQMDGNGNVLAGEQDYNDANGLTSPEPQGDTYTGGTLAINASGQGTLTLITSNSALGFNGTEVLAVQFVNANHALVVEFDGSATSSGSMDVQNLSAAPNGNYAWILSGVDPTLAPFGAGGLFSVSAGTLSNGLFDANDNGTTMTGQTFTGTVSTPDAFGRGTITGLGVVVLNYYVVGPEALRLIDVDSTDSAVGSAFGQGAGSFSATSLGSSVFGLESDSFGFLYSATGMFTTVPGSGTFQGVGDDDEEGSIVGGPTASAISGVYSMASTGYGSLTINNGGLGSVSSLGVYMTDPNLNISDPNNTAGGGGALVLDLDTSLSSGIGVIVPQTDTSSASFSGNYAFGSQDYNIVGEFDLLGQGSVTGGVLSGGGPISDPFGFYGGTDTDYSFAAMAGTATPDATNPGRYTMPLAITALTSPVNFAVVVYQASGTQLFLMDEDNFSLSLGPVEQQGSLTGVPAAKKPARKAQAKIKH
jgi:hypothetical protein